MQLNEAVKKTIKYSKRFGCILTREQIADRLISDKIFKKREVLEYLISIDYKNPYRNKFYKNKIELAKDLVSKIKEFKDVLFVGVTGSVAAEHPQENDDIDFLIITKRNKLWWTRLKLRWFIYKNKIPHRKYQVKENKDEYCFNYWTDEDALLLPPERQTLESAVDLILMKPLLNRRGVYEKFIYDNSWAKKWVATGYALKSFRDKNRKTNKRKISEKVWKIINILVFIPQYIFMKRKMINGEYVKLKIACFNRG